MTVGKRGKDAMTVPTKEVTLLDAEESRPPASTDLAPAASDALATFERFARDPSVDVDKLERLMAMQERIMAINREAAFEADFSRMQPKIPVIDEHGRIEVKGTLRSTYAPLEDIHDVIKPILAEYGFSIRHRTEWPADRPGIIRIVGILGHVQGHKEFTSFEAPMDRSDYRTDIQSQGSTVSYGRRYTTLDLLNISTRKADNDGQRRQPVPEAAPAGFEDWLLDLQSVAEEGLPTLTATWNKSRLDFRKHLTATNRDAWENLKKRAGEANRGR